MNRGYGLVNQGQIWEDIYSLGIFPYKFPSVGIFTPNITIGE